MPSGKTVDPYEHRRGVITGLRELADALDAFPDLPVPKVVDINYYPRKKNDAANLAEIKRIAKVLGVKPRIDRNAEHIRAVQRFSGVIYRAVTVTQQAKARWEEMKTTHTKNQPTSGHDETADETANPNAHR
jgi:lipopolysaccharide biosynthesis protein